jgi:hypothetical protein
VAVKWTTKNRDATKNSHNPFTNFSAGDYGLENFDQILTKVYPNNQMLIAENEVDQSINGVSSLENAKEPNKKRFKPDEKRNEKISKDSCLSITFMFIIFLAGSTKTCSGIANHLVIGLMCVFLWHAWVLVPLL